MRADMFYVTYQQSLELIEIMQNIVWPYSNEWLIFFDFKTETEFEVKFFPNLKVATQMDQYISAKLKEKLPYAIAQMGMDQHMDIPRFYYFDENINYEINLLTKVVSFSDSTERLRRCPINVGLEMIRLARKLEDMKSKKSG